MALPTPLQAFSGVPKINTAPDKQTIVDGEKMTGAQALIRSLEDLGVEDVFGIPGGAILPVYHEIKDNTKFRFVLMRHEQAAGHAAEGYALATGKVGVCIVTSGPGATNVVTAIADANMDSVPMVVITGQVGVQAIGTDAFQEADIVGITYPVSKHSFLVTRAQDIPRVLSEAYYIANTGRPGPVVVDLTKTAQTGDMYYSWPQRMILPGYNPTTKAHGRVLSDAVLSVVPPGAVCGWRRRPLQRRRTGQGSGRPDRRSRGHDPARTRHHSRLRPEEPRHARHARYDCRNRRRAAR